MKNKEKLAYYSHSQQIYNTKNERVEYDFIKEIFTSNIICSNLDIKENASKTEYLKAVKHSDWVFVSEFRGYIGEGSYKVCETALRNGIPLLAITKKGRKFLIKQVYNIEIIEKYNPVLHGILIY